MRYALAMLALAAAGWLAGADGAWDCWKCRRQCDSCGHGHGLFKGHGLLKGHGHGGLHGHGLGLHSGRSWTDVYPLCREPQPTGGYGHRYNRSPRDFFMADP